MFTDHSSINSYQVDNYFTITGILFISILIRYLFISGVFHYLFLVRFSRRFEERIINETRGLKHQMIKEVIWSTITSLIFACSGTLLFWMWQHNYTSMYDTLDKYPLWYLPVSLLIVLLIQETYYYWLHRWMHRPKIYRLVHKVHHDSIRTTAMTAFSFHPIESILQAITIPIIVFLLPIHLYVLAVFLLIMTISATINHAGIEFYPANFHRHWLGKWLIGATHHDQHHKKFLYNYGLYFTFWDKWMGTESDDYQVLPKKIKDV